MKTTALFLTALIIAGTVHAATTFSGRLYVRPSWTHEKTTGVSSTEETFSDLLDWAVTTGTNANQMTTIIAQSGTLTNSQSTAIDLTSTENGFGDAVNFATVRFLAIKADSTNADVIHMGAAGTRTFSTWAGATNDYVIVRPGGLALFVAPDLTGYVSTNGNLRISNATTNSAGYEIYVGGSE